MNPALRAAVAHFAVDDVDQPQLADDARHHLLTVLRARPGELVTVTDGAGRWRPCRVVGDGVETDGDAVSEPSPSPALTVAVAVPKADRPDWLVRKATEVGIDRILWLECRRSAVRWPAVRAESVLARMRRVVVDAALQSRRVWFPTVEGPVPAAEVIPGAVLAEPGGRALEPGDHVVAVGPEGGWDDDELVRARATVGLGPTILRVETAALVAAAEMVRLRSAATAEDRR